MKIITLTLNPAFDVHCSIDRFNVYHENVLKREAAEAGGKGVNVSRALSSCGVDNLAVVVVGKDNQAEFIEKLNADGLNFKYVSVPGRIRENITVHEPYNPETRISFEGFSCDKGVLTEVKEKIGEVDENTVITFTGSAPNGIDVSNIKDLLSELRKKGAKIVIDSRTFSLEDLIDFKPWLIKPNKDEAEKYTGKKISEISDAKEIALDLKTKGIENVIISLGELGAVLSCADGEFYALPPKVDALSTIGAGDSTIAGFISAYTDGKGSAERLKTAVAFGTAACLREGTLPPDGKDVQKIIKQIKVI